MTDVFRQFGEFLPNKNLVHLDKKDRKILSLLLSDAALPYAQLSKQIGLSKSNVARRIALLEQEGIIIGYHAFVDVSKLGIKAGLLLLHTQESQEKKQEILSKLSHHQSVYSVLELTGKYDVLAAFYYRENREKDSIVENILSLMIIKDFYLVNIKTTFPALEYTKELFAKQPYNKTSNENVAYDAYDLKILKALSENFRRSKVEIAQKLKISREMVSYRIKRLLSSGIIAKLQASVNPFALGFEPYFLILRLSRPTQRTKIIHFLSSTLRCNTILTTEDEGQIITFIHFKSHKEFILFENKLLTLFRDAIHEYSFEFMKGQYKLDWFPGTKRKSI